MKIGRMVEKGSLIPNIISISKKMATNSKWPPFKIFGGKNKTLGDFDENRYDGRVKYSDSEYQIIFEKNYPNFKMAAVQNFGGKNEKFTDFYEIW